MYHLNALKSKKWEKDVVISAQFMTISQDAN